LANTKKVVKVKLSDIILDPADILPYKIHDQQQKIERLVQQYKRGMKFDPIRLYDDFRIIDGHLRFYATQKLGLQEIDAIIEPRPKHI
jgi:ParB-like chromosome segregation protein Spo0J